MLDSLQRKDLVSYRIEKAYKSLEEAKGVARLKYWNLTGNRLYYTAFHMATALLLDRGFSAKTHAGVYDDTYDATEEEVLPYFEKVESFIKDMEALVIHK